MMAQGKVFVPAKWSERDVAAVFDAWYDEQPDAVQQEVDMHIVILTDRLGKGFGLLSAKMLLAEIYCLITPSPPAAGESVEGEGDE